MKMCHFASGIVGLALMAGGAVGQTSQLWWFDGDSPVYGSMQGGSVNTYPRQNYDFALAVSDKIYTIGRDPGGQGGIYNLDGSYAGPNVNNPFNGGQNLDGTTDGKQAYAMDYATSQIFQTANRDYTGGTSVLMSTAALGGTNYGVTYSSPDDTFYVTNSGGDIGQFDRNGSLLRSTNIGGGANYGIAYDAADDTLWVGRGGRTFTQVRASDLAVLQTFTANSGPNWTWGLEFASVPAPGSAALLGVGALVAARRRRA